MLELSNVRKEFKAPGEVIEAVNGIDLKVSQGEFVAIFGPSGSGKTTLLLLIGALLQADEGEVRYRGRDLRSLSADEVYAYRQHEVGFIFQDFLLLNPMSAKANVSLRMLVQGKRRSRAEHDALALLDMVGLRNRARQHAFRLSGGEKQRVAIARALAGPPSLILADEPTGNLDTDRGNQVLSLLGELSRSRGVAVILATHDQRAIRHADRVLELRDGRLAEIRPAEAAAAPTTAP